jgi:hypothetical protein
LRKSNSYIFISVHVGISGTVYSAEWDSTEFDWNTLFKLSNSMSGLNDGDGQYFKSKQNSANEFICRMTIVNVGKGRGLGYRIRGFIQVC